MAKKTISVLLAMLLLLLCGCSSNSVNGTAGNKSNSKWQPTGQKVDSSIFGRSIKYDSWSPAENITLPVDSSEISDVIQIEKTLYILGDGGVYTLEIESGKSQKLIDTDADLFYVYTETVYTYNTQNSFLSVYDISGNLIEECELPVQEVYSVTGLYVTDDCFVLSGLYDGGIEKQFTRFYSFNKETKELIESSKNFSYRAAVCGYKGNELLLISEDSFEQALLQSFNAQTAKAKELKSLGYKFLGENAVDLCYNPKTDTLILTYANYTDYYIDGGDKIVEVAVVEEHSLTESDSLVQQKFPLSVSKADSLYIGVFENIISCISTVENTFRYFDFQDPPKSITIAGSTYLIPTELIESFENKYEILVRTANIDYERLVLKLMAGDTDFDLFITMEGTNIILAGAYSDLAQYQPLKTRISGNKIVQFVSSHNDTYFGVPIDITNYYAKETWENSNGGFNGYSHIVSEMLYCAQNIDAARGEYLDRDGEKLYKLLKFICDNPDGNEDKMPFGKEIVLYSPFYLMMSRASEQKEMAQLFLEYAFDVMNGDISGIVDDSHIYPDVESTEGCYVAWKCMSMSYRLPISNARVKALQSDKDAKTLKKLAKEAAAEVVKRMME